MSPVLTSLGVYNICMFLDHNVPVDTISLICLAVCTLNFNLIFLELHKPMDFLGV
jgi:hypothetical protein